MMVNGEQWSQLDISHWWLAVHLEDPPSFSPSRGGPPKGPPAKEGQLASPVAPWTTWAMKTH